MGTIKRVTTNMSKHKFLFEQLVHRDFTQKYKRTILGQAWSILNPLLTMFIMRMVFAHFFGRNMEFYTTYLFAGNIVLSFFKEATKNGMTSLVGNASIITKINVPKYLFLLSKNVSSLYNFGLTLITFFVFCIIDGITFHVSFFALIYPIICLVMINLGVGMILSALYVFFRDTTYLYDVFLTLLTYLSAVFYSIDSFDEKTQRLFLLNPVYVIIKYFRLVVIEHQIPSLTYHGLCAFYAIIFLVIGSIIYKKFNNKFVYYF